MSPLSRPLALFCAIGGRREPKLKVALTFDDLPLNGLLPPGARNRTSRATPSRC
jgi:hypothetical protein